ncbi:MAG: SlyX family protein [Verrucomicrobia bacterium]|nr:SlyX family protein [Verrucomicrobiota bacterium]MCH8510136.1 SlyX family protein [Kiritimatiellia bacterium]
MSSSPLPDQNPADPGADRPAVRLEDRLTDLESRIAFLEHSLDTVNQTVLSLDRANRNFRQECDQLRQRVEEMGEAGSGQPDPPPPHY